MDIRKIIQAIDHTNLDPCATEEEILALLPPLLRAQALPASVCSPAM